MDGGVAIQDARYMEEDDTDFSDFGHPSSSRKLLSTSNYGRQTRTRWLGQGGGRARGSRRGTTCFPLSHILHPGKINLIPANHQSIVDEL